MAGNKTVWYRIHAATASGDQLNDVYILTLAWGTSWTLIDSLKVETASTQQK